MAGLDPATSGFWTVVTPDACIIQDTNSADLNSERHGQFQKREQKTLTTELNILFSKKFRRKIVKQDGRLPTAYFAPSHFCEEGF